MLKLLKQNWKALRAFNVLWAPPVYPVFVDEVKCVRRKIGQAKNRIRNCYKLQLRAINKETNWQNERQSACFGGSQLGYRDVRIKTSAHKGGSMSRMVSREKEWGEGGGGGGGWAKRGRRVWIGRTERGWSNAPVRQWAREWWGWLGVQFLRLNTTFLP